MVDPVSRLATRAAYGARQLPRVAWYIGHGLVMRRLSQAARAGASARRKPGTSAPVPDRRRLYADMAVLSKPASIPCPRIMTARHCSWSGAPGCSLRISPRSIAGASSGIPGRS
jgi:hypothetical protein